MSKKRNAARWVGPLFMGIGTIAVLVGLYLIYDAFSFARHAESAVGEVIRIDVQESRDSEGDTTITYLPTFRFTDENGQIHEAANHMASTGYDFGIGEQMDVLYDPDDPLDVRIEGFWSLYLLPLVLTFFGLSFGGIGFLVFRILRERAR